MSNSVEGLDVTRTVIFEAKTGKSYDWSKSLLTAVESAKRLGVTNFELSVTDGSYMTEIYSGGNSMWDNERRVIGSEKREASHVTVYAVRIK
jgi:hypothetical protein